MGARNRELAEEHFSTDNVAETWSLLQHIADPTADAGNDKPKFVPAALPTDTTTLEQPVGTR
jgi:hypothetical protein